MGNYDKMYEEIAEERMKEISAIIARGGRIPQDVNDERVYRLEQRCERLEKDFAELKTAFEALMERFSSPLGRN